MSTSNPGERHGGFTLVELVVVVVLIGILGAFAAPKFFDRSPFAERGYVDELATAMRYAQKTSVASGCNTSVTWDANGYQATLLAAPDAHCSNAPITRSDGATLTGTCPSDVVCPVGNLAFNPAGGLAAGAANLVVGTHTLNVDATSGLVVVQ